MTLGLTRSLGTNLRGSSVWLSHSDASEFTNDVAGGGGGEGISRDPAARGSGPLRKPVRRLIGNKRVN